MHYIRTLATQYPDARHIAFAWRIRGTNGVIAERFSDDGEPSGTAGRPILAPLEGQSIINTVVAVVRYFGGTKLGTGGLVRAYGEAAKLALEQVNMQPWIAMKTLKMSIDYSQLQHLEYQLKKCNGVIVDQKFTDGVHVTIELPASESGVIEELFL